VASAARLPAGPRAAGRRSLPIGGRTAALGALLALVAFNVVFTRGFVSQNALNVNLTQVAPILIVAVGMTLVIATKGIDLSVGSLMAISGAVAPLIFLSDASFLQSNAVAIPLAFVVPVLVAGAFGFFNGTLVTRFGIQPIIATLVLFIAGRGIAQALTNGELQAFREPSFQVIGLDQVFGIPVQVLIAAAIVLAAGFALSRTTFGRYVLAVGGTSLMGGRATIVGTVIGALIIQLLRFTLLSHGVSAAIALVVQAGIILVAVVLQREGRVRA